MAECPSKPPLLSPDTTLESQAGAAYSTDLRTPVVDKALLSRCLRKHHKFEEDGPLLLQVLHRNFVNRLKRNVQQARTSAAKRRRPRKQCLLNRTREPLRLSQPRVMTGPTGSAARLLTRHHAAETTRKVAAEGCVGLRSPRHYESKRPLESWRRVPRAA